VAVCGSVLHCVAVCCSVLQCVAVCVGLCDGPERLQKVEATFDDWMKGSVCCSVLQCVVVRVAVGSAV